jgi:CBS domain containing-hemolysin-like protein
LRLFLWLIIGITVAAAFVLLTLVAPAWLGGITIALVIWYAFAWAPNGRLTGAGARLAVWVTPAIAWALYYTHTPLDWLYRTIERHRHITFHTGLFERDDLIELIEQQRQLADSRIAQAELDIVLNALTFSDKTAASIMVPGREVKSVHESDALGPIVMDELYESGFSRFPVIAGDGHTIVGTLYLRDLVVKREGGLIRDVMKPNVCFVHESQTLYQVLHAFLTTKHQLFVVVNDEEQYVGIVTIEDVLEQVIGHKIEDEFDAYDDRHAVANYASRRRVKPASTSVEADSGVAEQVNIEPNGEAHEIHHWFEDDEAAITIEQD